MKELIFNSSDFLKGEAVERRVEKFEGDLGFPSEISVYLKAVKVSDDKIYVSGAAEGYVSMECSRCLCVYRHPVEIYVSVDMDFLNGIADMSEEIRQLAILEIPQKPLCSQECPGICPKCGKQNDENGLCSCAKGENEEFAKQRWENLFKKN